MVVSVVRTAVIASLRAAHQGTNRRRHVVFTSQRPKPAHAGGQWCQTRASAAPASPPYVVGGVHKELHRVLEWRKSVAAGLAVRQSRHFFAAWEPSRRPDVTAVDSRTGMTKSAKQG